MFGWIRKHKITTFFITVGTIIIPLIIVNLLFKGRTEIDFLVAEWDAGDLLSYIAAFEAFIGTIVLGLVALKQNEDLGKINNELIKLQKAEYLPTFYLCKDKFKAKFLTFQRDYNPTSAIIANVFDTRITQRVYDLHLTHGGNDKQHQRFINYITFDFSGKIPCNKIEFLSSKWAHIVDIGDFSQNKNIVCENFKEKNIFDRYLQQGDNLVIWNTLDVNINIGMNLCTEIKFKITDIAANEFIVTCIVCCLYNPVSEENFVFDSTCKVEWA